MPSVTIPADRRVALRIGFVETELHEQIKSTGGYWNPDKKAWILSYRRVLQMGLDRRVIDEIGSL
jgi:hypothetical protein